MSEAESKPPVPVPAAPAAPAAKPGKKPDAIEQKLLQMLHKLPELPPALGSYVPALRVGNLLYISGQLPIFKNSLGAYKGRLGKEITLEAAQRGAKQCTLNALALAKNELGTLEKIRRVIKLTGFVAGMPGFVDQPKVLNAASELLVELYGENGKHTRVAVGVTDLPMGACVEIEYLFEVR
ncbi:RidA family protein [Deltaproteobacteria bacterium PRO3]|nr:RidA family protein [Deltaproteobacteria bacterium PRO3]